MHLPQIVLLKRLRSCILFSNTFISDIVPGDGGACGRGSDGCCVVCSGAAASEVVAMTGVRSEPHVPLHLLFSQAAAV